jgi:hypothetical protein
MPMKKHYVFSTLSNDQLYTQWIKQPDPQPPVIGAQVLIKGGFGIADKNFITPRGTVTEIDDDQYDVLKTVPQFLEHLKNGFIQVMTKHSEPEKVAANMNRADPSQPKTASDYQDGSQGVRPADQREGSRAIF